MPTLLAVMIGSVFWVLSWGLGLKGFDGFLVMLLIVLGAATVQLMAPYLPGNRSQDQESSDPAPFN